MFDSTVQHISQTNAIQDIGPYVLWSLGRLFLFQRVFFPKTFFILRHLVRFTVFLWNWCTLPGPDANECWKVSSEIVKANPFNSKISGLTFFRICVFVASSSELSSELSSSLLLSLGVALVFWFATLVVMVGCKYTVYMSYVHQCVAHTIWSWSYIPGVSFFSFAALQLHFHLNYYHHFLQLWWLLSSAIQNEMSLIGKNINKRRPIIPRAPWHAHKLKPNKKGILFRRPLFSMTNYVQM